MAKSGRMHTTPLRRSLAVATLAGVVWAGAACSKPASEDTPSVPEFEKRIAAYLDLQKTVIGQLPALKRTDDPKEITSREMAMGEAIRAARANAKQGDIIVPETAAHMRKLIKEDVDSRTAPEKKTLRDELPPFTPAVNQTYPSDHPLATFPATLLKVMPTLPEGLEYRFAANALIIRDIKANIIIDYILDVF
jgi:hypothetical protein